MQQRPPTLLILDDRDRLRENLREMFEARGFETHDAGTTVEAREIFLRSPADFDVLILDMHLKEPSTGADFGIEVRERYPDHPPEFLIYSGYQDPAYYQLAMTLGAAAYLRKADPPDPTNLVRHARGLALRRAFRPRPGVTARLAALVRGSRSQAEATDRFCQEVLRPELDRALGGRFLLLLSDEAGTRAFSNDGPEPATGSPYALIQSAVFDDLAESQPIIFHDDEGPPLDLIRKYQRPGGEEVAVATPFLRLVDMKGFRLSLGLLQGAVPHLSDSGELVELARILDRYLRYALVDHLLDIAQWFAKLEAEKEAEKRGVLQASGSFCRGVGHEVLISLDQGIAPERDPMADPDSAYVKLKRSSYSKLRTLGEELRDTGELLEELVIPTEGLDTIQVAPLVRAAWKDLVGRRQVPQGFGLDVEGECVAGGRRDRLMSAVYRVLLWFARRKVETATGEEPRVSVRCGPGSLVAFEDRSTRLPPGIRERLLAEDSPPYLEPITDVRDKGRRMGLFLAKALVEAQGGRLEDRSDDLGGEVGHRLVMRLPQPPTAA